VEPAKMLRRSPAVARLMAGRRGFSL